MPPEELHASALRHWPASRSDLPAQRAAAERAVDRVEDGQLIGIGSGPEAYHLLRGLGRRAAREPALKIAVVCCTLEAETTALNLGLSVHELGSVAPDWGVDAVDEVDPDDRLLNSHGSAPFRAKLLWRTAQRMFLADHSSMSVPTLGRQLPLPVEVHRDAITLAARELARLGADDVALRLAVNKDGPVFTSSRNLLLDAHFSELASGLDAEIRSVPGVIATGLFEGCRFTLL